jgi:hypothetical protein
MQVEVSISFETTGSVRIPGAGDALAETRRNSHVLAS